MPPTKTTTFEDRREATGRPVQGNTGDDRILCGDRRPRVCTDCFPACSFAGRTILRALRVRFFRHRGIYRSDGGVSPLLGLESCGASRWSALGSTVGRGFAPAPSSSSTMSSGRLFLDRVARQQSPSPLHRHAQITTRSSRPRTKGDILTLQKKGHFYFALTDPGTPLRPP